MFLVILPLHVVDVPAKAQSPPHPVKVEPESGAAVMVTAVPDANTVPDGFDVIVPEPVPAVAVVRVYVVVPLLDCAKVAAMVWLAVTLENV
jgi:hypothetical protein